MKLLCCNEVYAYVKGSGNVQASCGRPAAGIWTRYVMGRFGRPLKRCHAICASCHKASAGSISQEWHDKRAREAGVPMSYWTPLVPG